MSGLKRNTTYVWGVAADEIGHVHWRHVTSETRSDGSLVAYASDEYARDPASTYASLHPAPLAMRWGHAEDIGRIIALRRQHGKLYAVGTTDLTVAELDALAAEHGALRWSTSTITTGRRGTPLQLREITLTGKPASVGLPDVTYYRLGESRGNPPTWVTADINRGTETRSERAKQIEVLDLDDPDIVTAAEMRAAGIVGELCYSAPIGTVLKVGGQPIRG